MKTEKEINKELRDFAVSNGLCQEWQDMWEEDWNYEKMIEMFWNGIDFFLAKRFVDNDYINNNFDKDFLRDNGIIVDDKYSLLNPKNAIIIGDSTSVVRVNGYKASTIYALDNCHLKVTSKNRSFVIVHVLGKAKVDTSKYDLSRLVVILHSREATVTGNAIVREEYDYLKK